MDFAFSDKVKELQRRLEAFMDEYIYPNEQRYYDEIERNRWSPPPSLKNSSQKPAPQGCGICFCRMKCTARG